MRRFTHTFPQRISAFLLCLALLVGLLPTAAFAAETDTGKAIQIGASGISGYDSMNNSYDYIYYGNWTAPDENTTSGPIKWRVLDTKTNMANATEGDGLFLLSDVLLGTGTNGGVYFDNTEPCSNTWQGSDAQSWCSTFYSNNLTTQEQGAVLATTKSDEAFTSSFYNIQFAASNNILNGDKVFFLSAEEAETSGYGSSAGYWWLRSPSADNTGYAGLVGHNGGVDHSIVDYARAARPAFNLDLNSVLFTSAAVGGKIPAAESGGQGGEAADAIFEIGAYTGNEWKLTLLDNSRNFAVTEKTASGKPGDTITLNYTGATTGENEYISVIIADKSGAQYYGRVAQPTEASGQIQIKIPASLADGTYTLNVFSEQYNGGENDDTKLTDYASAFEAVTLTVDATAPKLSDGSATRDGENEAMVKFTSDEAGSYYYVVDNNATAPDSIDTTTTAGTSCKANEETEISIDSLSNGVQYIHIVVKDAVNNVSNVLTIPIPAYTYTLTVELNGGSGSATGGEYAENAVVNIDAGSRSNYRFTGWTTSNGGTFASASSASTTFTMPAADTTITANWQYNPPYIPPTKTPSQQAIDKIEDAKEGSTVKITLRTGQTKLDKEVFEELAGRDVTLEISLPGGVTWTVNGEDIPKTANLTDLDMGVSLNTSTIPVDLINAITGEIGTVQLTLKHDGPFGFTMTLTAPVGKENKGLWANLYHYDEDAGEMVYQTSALVDEDGNAALPFDHASQYALVLDSKSHELPFTDLGENQWYESAVAYAYRHSIMEGMSATTFVPSKSLTRAEAVQVLYNLEGQPTVSESTTFPDLVYEWYKPAIAWAESTGVVDGYEDGAFRPDQPVTREEYAQMLYDYAAYKDYDLTAEGDLSAFPDGSEVQEWALPAMSWANGNALINGHDDGTLEPGGTTTRAQAAAVLMRFDQDLAE